MPSTSATRRSPIKAEEELQKYIAEGPKVFRRNEYQAFADLRRLSGFGDSLKKTILGNESLRYRELERKVEEATKCAIQIDGGIPNWYRPSVDDDNLLKIFPFLPPELRRKILADITPRYTWQLAFKARHLLSRSELEPLIEMGNYETQIRLCRQKDGAACFSKLQLIRLVHIACGIADRQKRADAIADMGRALPHLDDRHRSDLLGAAILLEDDAHRQRALVGLSAGICCLNDDQYRRMIGSLMTLAPDPRARGLHEVAKHMDQLSETQREYLFSILSDIHSDGERDHAIAQLSAGVATLPPEQRGQVVNAVLRSLNTPARSEDIQGLRDLCNGLSPLDEDQRTRLFNVVMALPADSMKTDLVEALAGQISHLSPAQIDMVADMAARSSARGMAMLIRGRSSATTTVKQLRCVNRVLEAAATWYAKGEVLSQVMDVLSEEECRQFARYALEERNEDRKSKAMASAGQALDRLSERQREGLVQAAEGMTEPTHKVEVVIGLSQGMAHLSREQCERLFEVARSASPNARFDGHNIRALHALLVAEWPWSASWDETGAAARSTRTASLDDLPKELQERIIENLRASRGGEYLAFSHMNALSASGKSFQELIRNDEGLRYGELQRKAMEAAGCMDQIRLGQEWHENDANLVRMMPFLPRAHQEQIFRKFMRSTAWSWQAWRDCWSSISKAQDLLSKRKLGRLIRSFIQNRGYSTHIAICSELKDPKAHFTKTQLQDLVNGVCTIPEPRKRASRLSGMGGVLTLLDDEQRGLILDAATSLDTEVQRQHALGGLTAGIGHLNEQQYQRMIAAVMTMSPGRRNKSLHAMAKHLDQLDDARRDHLLSAVNGIQHLGERDRSLAQLAGALPRLNPEQCIMVFDAVLRPVAWQRDIGRLHDLCSGLGVLNNDRRSLLFNAVLALPPANPSTPFVVAELAGQIAHLSPAQVDLVNEMAASSGIGLTMLIRGRSVARGEQRRHIDSKNIVETALTRNQADWIHGLSQVTELLNDEECRRCAEAALALGVEPLKADAVAAAGQALHRLPEPLRETLIQAAESMADPKNKVEAVVGLSRGMAHLSPRQCERLFEVGRSASPNGRFDHHNIRALEALVTAEWPWSARWDRPHPPQRQPNPDQVSRAPETV